MALNAKVRGTEVWSTGVEKTRSQTTWIPSPVQLLGGARSQASLLCQ